jgi:CubicO group peptidase (beta-lactamase class C family)
MTTSVLIIRHGYIVFEQYYMGDQGTPRTVWSVTKSVVSALVGIAIREGYLKNVDQKMVEFFPEYVSTDMNPDVNKVTIHHLLTMSGGVAKEEDEGFSREVFQRTLRNDPGKEFFYNNLGPDILSLIITKTSGLKCIDFGKKYLFEPLGISNIAWSSSTASGVSYSPGGYGLQLTARDMAKLGYLYLNQGTWDKKQVVPSEWVEASSREQIKTPESEDWLEDYGYLWWIRPKPNHSAYSAVGFGGQYIYVIPDLDIVTVITTLGSDEDTPSYLAIMDNYVGPAVTN